MAYTRVLMVFRGFDCHGAGIRCDFCIGLGRRAYTKNKPKNKATMFAASILNRIAATICISGCAYGLSVLLLVDVLIEALMTLPSFLKR